MRSILLLFTVLSIFICNAQQREYRIFKWAAAGVDAFVWPVYSERTLNCDGGNCADELQSIIDQSPHPLVVNIPEGIFVLNKSISLPSQTIIRGVGSNRSKLIFDVSEGEHGFVALQNMRSNTRLQIIGRPQRSDSVITFTKCNAVKVGDHLRFIFDDKSFVTRNWGLNSTGQIVRVKDVTDSLVTTDVPFRMRYSSHFNFHVEVVNPIEEVGIEHVHIVRRSTSDKQVSNVFFRGVYKGFVYGVVSDSCHYAHADARTSRFIHVEKCFFNDAHDYGEGGKAYGVMLQLGTCDSRVVDNAFVFLRHSMITQAGANGNVFAYNYSINVKATRQLLGLEFAHTLSGDMVVHGNYPYANLFEGNRAHMGIIDNAHGKNGPDNMFYRNHVSPNGITVTNPSTVECTFIENEADGLSFFLGTRHVVMGNSFDRHSPRSLDDVYSLGCDVFPNGISTDMLRAIGHGTANDVPLPAETRYKNKKYTPQSGTLLIHKED